MRQVMFLFAVLAISTISCADSQQVVTTAHEVPKHTTNQGSGYFSLIEGNDGKVYIGTAKYGVNGYVVAFDPKTKGMQVVVDCQKEIGTDATGFAAQAKIHTRNNIGKSGKIYFATKQGYPQNNEKGIAYPGGYSFAYDPATGTTEVWGIPVPHHGIISITPDESRDVAYISTCNDERPIESTHFMKLDLKTGEYTHLMDAQHLYAFIVVDYKGRAYHPILGGDIARYDPSTEKLERLKQTIDGQPPSADSHLADEHAHPINWDISPDGKTLYAIPMNNNGLYAYDLTSNDEGVLAGRLIDELVPDTIKTDCRAMCVASDGKVWATVRAKKQPKQGYIHVVSYTPGEKQVIDHGRVVVGNPTFTKFTDENGKLPWHHGYSTTDSGLLEPRFGSLAICAADDGTIYFTTLSPLTLHAWTPPNPGSGRN